MATKLYAEQATQAHGAETVTVQRKPAKLERLAFIGMKGLPADLPGAGGGERETEAKTKRLAARGYEVTVYCRQNYTGKTPAPFHGIDLVALPSMNKPGLEMLSHTLFSTLHALIVRRAEVINYHGMGNALYLPLVKLFGKRAVVYMDGIDWERPKWGKSAQLLLKWGAAAAFRWSDEVYTDNAASQRQFAAIFGREPKLITLAADLWESPGSDQLAGLGLEADTYLLFVGMLR
ncbi:MAG: glycosyltransferase, partial [Caldilineaceae bacterium]|nr:glycosyltransferase [Caldilineaceae bacterium]